MRNRILAAIFSMAIAVSGLAIAPVTAVGATPPDYTPYVTVYEVNSKTYQDSKATCVDRKVDSKTQDNCTLRKALELTNALGGTGKVLITLNANFAANIGPTQPWILVSGDASMCTTQCTSTSEDYGAYFWINRDNVTVDLQGLLGISDTERDDPNREVFAITAKNATLNGFNGLYGSEAAVVLFPGADGFRMANGSTNQRAVATLKGDNGKPVATDFLNSWMTERWLVIVGKVSDIQIRNWEVSGLYYGGGSNQGAVIFRGATVDGLLLDNILFDGGGDGTCSSSNGKGCNMNGWMVNDTNKLTNVTLRNCVFKDFHGGSEKIPFQFYANHTTMDNWTFDSDQFLNITVAYDYEGIAGWYTANIGQNGSFGLKVTNCIFSGNHGFTKGLFSAYGDKVKNVTFANNLFENNQSGAGSDLYGDIWGGFDGDTDGFTVNNNRFYNNGRASTNTTESAFNFYSANTLKNLEFSTNTLEGDSYGRNWLRLDTTDTTLTNLKVLGNSFNNLRIVNNNHPVIEMPARSISGTNTIQNNHVGLASNSGSGEHFIDWTGNKSPGQSSNLSITDNDFSGFTGSTIRVQGQGTTTIRRNTFNNDSSQSGGNGQVEEGFNNNATTGYLVQNRGDSNSQIGTVYPSEVTAIDTRDCSASVSVTTDAKNLTALPLTVDWYATTGDDAEIYLGTTTQPATTATARVDLTQADGMKALKLRAQTTNANGESSNYSRWTTLGNITCDPETWTITKTGYSDNAHTTVVPSGSIVTLGQTIYWVYTVKNDYRHGIGVWVSDSMKTNGPVCRATADRLSTATCTWNQTMTEDVVTP